MKFEYALTGAGWADGYIEFNSNTVYFTASYINDALGDMLKAIISLIPEISSYSVPQAQFEWNEEPGGTVWTISRREDLLHIEILSYEDLRNR